MFASLGYATPRVPPRPAFAVVTPLVFRKRVLGVYE
jgi:hypothetical protein